MAKFKVFTKSDADIDNDRVIAIYSHVILFDKQDNKYLEVGYTGNEGEVFNSDSEARKAVDKYKEGNFNLRFLDFKIEEV